MEKIIGEKVLVTGGAGFIGSNLCETLLNNGNKVICLDNFLTGNIYGENIYYVVDSYLRNNSNTLENKLTPALRNTMGQLTLKLYKEYSNKYKLKQIFDKKLIQLLEKDPEKYKKRYDEFSLDMPYIVVKKCQWMLNTKKYNL